MQHSLLVACLAAATAALLLTAASAQCPQHGWTHRDHSCYKWFSDPNYWFQAEQTCLSHRAHLVSIGSEHENRLAGRLSHCRDAWIGRFGTDLNRLTDPRAYMWTDGSDAVRFERHNFSQLDTVHKPLIRSDGEWWLNSLYHERHPFVCEVSANSSHASYRCPSGWSLHGNHCYVMPHFEANFNEANFYCQRNSSHLVSVLTDSELSFINKLTFGIDSCEKSEALDSVWIGLIKLNPCFPDSEGRELCYQWTDFSGKLAAIPPWETGHPGREDWTVNCATLSAGRLRSDRCHSRHRFVCKSVAANDTDGGVAPPPVEGLVAAFDFRRGLDNLVDPSTFAIEDKFGVQRTAEDGACFKWNGTDYRNGEFYGVGGRVPFNESISAAAEWTVYSRMQFGSSNGAYLFSMANYNLTGSPYNYRNSYARLNQHWSGTYLNAWQLKPVNSTHFNEFSNTLNYTSQHCVGSWCDVRLAVKNHVANSSIGGETGRNYFSSWTYSVSRDFGLQQIEIGLVYYNSYDPRLCVRCFGLAHKQLRAEEVQRAMSVYCP